MKGYVKTIKRYIKDCGDESAASSTQDTIRSSMPGTIQKVNVKAGDRVKAGDVLVTLMSMKNEYVFKASRDGVIQLVKVKPDQAVAKDFIMIKFEPLE